MKTPTMEERLQTEAQFVGPAHGADWHDVDYGGDLLYIGSSACIARRLKPPQHIMWTITHRRAELADVRIAAWITEGYEKLEGALTGHCVPLWSACAEFPSRWEAPTAIAAPRETAGFTASGVYAWLFWPKGREFNTIMLDGAGSRRLRKKPAPTVRYCSRCYYATLACVHTACSRCGYMHTTKEAREQVRRVFDEEDSE